MTAEASDQPSPEPGLVPLARPGAHWTPEEQEILVTEVREGKDMTAIMDHHGRNRTGIEERLVMMVPDEAQVPDDEKLGWILDRLAANPDYDWAAQVERTRLARSARRSSRSLDHENSLTRAPRLTEPGTILGIWEHINHLELRDQRKAAFLASEALYDLTVYETGTLTQIAAAWPSVPSASAAGPRRPRSQPRPAHGLVHRRGRRLAARPGNRLAARREPVRHRRRVRPRPLRAAARPLVRQVPTSTGPSP